MEASQQARANLNRHNYATQPIDNRLRRSNRSEERYAMRTAPPSKVSTKDDILNRLRRLSSPRSPRQPINNSNRNNRPAPKRRSGCLSIMLGLMVIVLLGVVVLTRQANETLSIIQRNDPRQSATHDASNPSNDTPAGSQAVPDIFTVLLIGVDKRDDPNEGARSDTLIVVNVNLKDRWAGMLSIPRDTVARIPNMGRQKINAAYSYGYSNAEELYGKGVDPSLGGGAMAAETVEDYLGIKIDYIAQIDFHGFERVVDSLGGVSVDVTKPLLDAEYPTETYGYERIYIPYGLQIMDGHTALRYARSRHSGSDFERSKRQQQVLRAILTDVQRRNLLSQASLFPIVMRELEKSIITTAPIGDLNTLRRLADFAAGLSPDRIVQFSINPNDVRVISEQGSDIIWDEDDVKALVERWQAGPQKEETPQEARIQVQNGSGTQGLAARVTSLLTTEGFTLNAASNASQVIEHTIIIDYAGRPDVRQRLAAMLHVSEDNIFEKPPPNAPPAPYQTEIVVVLGQDFQEQ